MGSSANSSSNTSVCNESYCLLGYDGQARVSLGPNSNYTDTPHVGTYSMLISSAPKLITGIDILSN